MDNNEYIPVNLGEDEALVKTMEYATLTYGGAIPNADIDECKIEFRIAKDPRVVNYTDLCNRGKINVSEDVKELYRRFDVWLINHSVGIMDHSNICNVIQFGFRVYYDKGVQIEELMPETKFIDSKINGGFDFKADIGANGQAKIADLSINSESFPIDASAGGEMKLSIGANLGIRLAFPTLSPLITAIGKYSNYSEWCVSRDITPLVGDQIFSQIIITEKGLEKLSFKSQVYCTLRKFGVLNSRRESKFIDNDNIKLYTQ